MEKQKVDLYLSVNAKYFEPTVIPIIKQKLEEAVNESVFLQIQSCELKDPTTMIIVSVLVGGLGIDRFMLGDTGMGVLKLLTGGCCGVLTIIDWCTIMKQTRQKNFEKILSILQGSARKIYLDKIRKSK